MVNKRKIEEISIKPVISIGRVRIKLHHEGVWNAGTPLDTLGTGAEHEERRIKRK